MSISDWLCLRIKKKKKLALKELCKELKYVTYQPILQGLVGVAQAQLCQNIGGNIFLHTGESPKWVKSRRQRKKKKKTERWW